RTAIRRPAVEARGTRLQGQGHPPDAVPFPSRSTGLVRLVTHHMVFNETPLEGAYTIDISPIPDTRGFFARAWSPEEFERLGLDPTLVQCSIAWNKARGTLRGMHFQRAPFSEVKMVRCTRGAVLDVIVDLRPDSPSLCRWTSVELSDSNRRMLYIPKGF